MKLVSSTIPTFSAEAPPPQGGQDELLLDADRLAEQDEPVKAQLGGGRRRGR